MLAMTLGQDYTKSPNGCDGYDFVCSTRGGIPSCRPCDFPQLAVFEDLQRQTNRLVAALDVSLPAAARARDGVNALWIDGRIGPKTTTAVGMAAAALGADAPDAIRGALLAAAKAPADPASHAKVAEWAPSILAYFKTAADAAGATTTPPEGHPTDEELRRRAAEEATPEAAPAPEGFPWGYAALGLLVAGVAGGGIYLAVRKRRPRRRTSRSR